VGNKNIAADSKLTKKQAQLIIGSSLSNTSKMPCIPSISQRYTAKRDQNL